ncbi:glycosyltransferase family A protein [Salipiger sp. IMCC34102]|uniref:glycosyltransferase family A protein n=1 Tax=Salipiger sp. IMCC34102 TaxID=2510647 RepID=UPI0013EA4059|nr:glycosyltransferase family A protein [Salipiger sp. IMCC34102]
MEFDVRPGEIYQLTLLLQKVSDIAGGICEMPVVFSDAQGRPLDPRLGCGALALTDPGPLDIEVAPAGPLEDSARVAATAIRFLVAPPDAARLTIGDPPEGVALHRVNLDPLSVLWHADEGQRLLGDLKRQVALRLDLAARVWQDAGDLPALWDGPIRTPADQAEALIAAHTRGGDWSAALGLDAMETELRDHALRTARQRAGAETPVKVGFIGSPRGYDRLGAIAETIWIRESEVHDQLDMFVPDVVVVEAGADTPAPRDDWQMAFSAGFGGDLPARGAALFEAAGARGIPVHLWVTGLPDVAPLWRGAADRADRVIAEGQGQDWSDLAPDAIVARGVEPASVSMAHPGDRPDDLMLVPAATDISQSPTFFDLVDGGALYDTLLCDFTYGFKSSTLSKRLTNPDLEIVAEHIPARARALLQAARLVLLPGRSVRSDAALAQIAIDAIASGAIPVLFGAYEGNEPILSGLDTVASAPDLLRLQTLMRVSWVRQRRWRTLWRQVTRDCVWTSADRTALLGRDPFPKSFDRPRVSVVLPTRRPHLFPACLENFRRQSWPDAELIVVFNTGGIPRDLPALRDNEHVHALPITATVGECLNRGITDATGRYWVKMDDDDFYADTYLEETAGYFRASQADATGRQAAAFYFEGPDETVWRERVTARCSSLLAGPVPVSGASLSGDAEAGLPPFSMAMKNTADGDWQERLRAGGFRMFSGDGISMVVQRGADEASHTWKLSAARIIMDDLRPVTTGRLSDRLNA